MPWKEEPSTLSGDTASRPTIVYEGQAGESGPSPSSGTLVLLSPWLPPIMNETRVHVDDIDLPKGNVMSTRFTTSSDRFGQGQFVTLQTNDYDHYFPMANLWISNTPNGAPIHRTAIMIRGIKASELNFTQGWTWFTNTVNGPKQSRPRLEPNRNYYFNVEDWDNTGTLDPAYRPGLLKSPGKIRRKVKYLPLDRKPTL